LWRLSSFGQTNKFAAFLVKRIIEVPLCLVSYRLIYIASGHIAREFKPLHKRLSRDVFVAPLVVLS